MAEGTETSWLRKATRLHREGHFEEAIVAYRQALAERDEPAASILLANLLISAPAPSTIQAGARRIQAAALADSAIKAVETLPTPKQQAALYARHGYFLLQLAGAFGGGGGSDQAADEESHGDAPGADSSSTSVAAVAGAKHAVVAMPAVPARKPSTGEQTSIEAAVRSLERASLLDPSVTIAWRNLSIAYRSLGRERDAEVALRKAIESCSLSGTGSGKPPADLLYRHYKALKALGDVDGAAMRLLDTLAADPSHMLASFWVRVMAADAAAAAKAQVPAGDGRPRVSASALEKLQAYLSKPSDAAGGCGAGVSCATSSSSLGTAGAGASVAPGVDLAVPHEYIKRLFDGYAPKFEDHLTQHLGYKTPKVLLDLAIEACSKVGFKGEEAPGGKPRWQRCADLGCGTGLAGIEFRQHVAYLAGVDLSGGMVDQARRRAGLYDELAVASVEGWLQEQLARMQDSASATADKAEACGRSEYAGFDCVVAADVFVYIGDLDAIFASTAALMAPYGTTAADSLATAPVASRAPPLFIFSTEADLLAEAADGAAEPADAAGAPGFRLTGTGRCVHAKSYILALAKKHGFRAASVNRRAIRQNAGIPVMGDLYVLQRVLST